MDADNQNVDTEMSVPDDDGQVKVIPAPPSTKHSFNVKEKVEKSLADKFN